MIFPTNAITKTFELSGSSTVEVAPTGEWTIYGYSTKQEKTGTASSLLCGSTPVSINYEGEISQELFQYYCSDSITIDKTGNDRDFFIVTYAPGFTNKATSTLGYTPPADFSTSTQIITYGSFTAGEIVISVLLFLMIVLKIAEYIARSLDRIITKKKYLGYSGGDVEIREDL